jgi:phosphoserine phosphatase RsbU/P
MPEDTKPLRILYLEDDSLDVELTQAALADGGIEYEVTLVQGRADFTAALEGGDEFDLLLADYSLPDFDGLSALEIAREVRPEVPFILVSGAVGEDRAIEALKSGATDYVLKQRLERLVPAVRRAMSAAEERAKRKWAEEERERLLISERAARERVLSILESISDAFYALDGEGRFTYVNRKAEELW